MSPSLSLWPRPRQVGPWSSCGGAEVVGARRLCGVARVLAVRGHLRGAVSATCVNGCPCAAAFRPRLKNVDRSTAQQLAVTVGNVTVIITDFKEKTRSSSTSSSTVTSSAGSEQQNQSSSGSESTDKGSSRSSTPKGDMSVANDESF